MKAKRMLSSNALGAGVLYMLAVVFGMAGCRADADLSNIDTTAELEMGLALPVGSIDVTMGDLLGNSTDSIDNLYFAADGTLGIRGEYSRNESFHDLDLSQYVSNAEKTLNLYEPIKEQADILRAQFPFLNIPENTIVGIPGYPMTIPIDFDIYIEYEGINNELTNERLDSISITEALLGAYLQAKDLPFDFDWIDTISMEFGEEFRFNGDHRFLLYAKDPNITQDVDFGTKIPIDLQRFVLDLVEDHTQPVGNTNVVNASTMQVHIVLTVPEDAPQTPINANMGVIFGLDVQFITFDAIWGMFKASNMMTDENVVDLTSAFGNWTLFKDMRLPLAEPSIKLDITHQIAGPLYIQGDYLFVRSRDGGTRYAEFGDDRRHEVRFPEDLATNPDSWMSSFTSQIGDYTTLHVELDNTPEHGRIDQMFSIMPEEFGYKFFVDFDPTVAPQIRITPITEIAIAASLDVPLVFNEGLYLTYEDTIPNLSLNSVNLDSILSSVVDSITVGELKLKLQIENSLPMQLELELYCLDQYGKVVCDSKGDTLRLSTTNTLTIPSPEYSLQNNQIVMTTPGTLEDILNLSVSQFDTFDDISSIVYRITMHNESLQPMFDANPNFHSRINKNDKLRIGMGVGARVGAVLKLF
ncbi:MAG: hypothetical protein ACI4BD_07315 [Paludibacteraceae bacterium]